MRSFIVFIVCCAFSSNIIAESDVSVPENHVENASASSFIPTHFMIYDSEKTSCNSQDSCFSIINEKLAKSWSRPPSTRKGMLAVVYVELENERRAKIGLSKSSGNSSYDLSCLRSFQEAFIGAEIKKLKELFPKEKRISFNFTPDDLEY